MRQSYILVEAVNIYANIFDTNQLSVIRGGSFLLKKAIEQIKQVFEDQHKQLTAISTGASSGLFSVNSHIDVVQLTQEIVNYLNNTDLDYSLLSFIVEYCTADSLLDAKEQLLAQLRITQMQSLTCVPDFKIADNPELAYPDTLEGRRIATKNHQKVIQKKTRQLSHSVYQRWQYGKELKQNYYFEGSAIQQTEQFRQLGTYFFSDNFEELAEHSAYTKLNAKMAVIYMDGNRFGHILRNLLENAPDQILAYQTFDQTIQTYHAGFLYQLLIEMTSSDKESGLQDALQNDGKTLRFETLFWGGDEMLFVLPAWLGFSFLQYFFNASKHWKVEQEQDEAPNTHYELTHATGIVFCNAHTPINHIRQLAQLLAEKAKECSAKDSLNNLTGREQNSWSYMVLESIDYPTNNDIDDFNNQHYGSLFSKPSLIPVTHNWQTAQVSLNQLINDGLLPQRQLYRIVQSINVSDKPKLSTVQDTENEKWVEQLQAKQKQQPDDLTALEQTELRLIQVSADKENLQTTLKDVAKQLFDLNINNADSRLCFWIYLYDLWDYLSPKASQENQAGEQV